MSIETKEPGKPSRYLYRQAKSKPQWKAWSLYGDVCRREVLEAALRQVIANGGAPGVDGVRVENLAQDQGHRELWLAKPEADLRGKTYRPSPVRRVYIPKADGKKRALGIPTVRDRGSPARRPPLFPSAASVVDADLSGYFDTIPPRRRRGIGRLGGGRATPS